jgi:hypothetical protein
MKHAQRGPPSAHVGEFSLQKLRRLGSAGLLLLLLLQLRRLAENTVLAAGTRFSLQVLCHSTASLHDTQRLLCHRHQSMAQNEIEASSDGMCMQS